MLYLIDGYNFFHTTNLRLDNLKPIYSFADILIRVAEKKSPKKFHLVFDGFSPSYYDYKTAPNHPNLRIKFSHEESADSVLGKLLSNISNKNECTLVTNDRQIILIAKENNIKIISNNDFEILLLKFLEN